MIEKLYKKGYTQNRELSWLRFDERCLKEAGDPQVPLLERLKFLAIFSGNLDEFFSVRVGSLTEKKRLDPRSVDNKSGLTPEGQLKAIYAQADKLCKVRELTYKDLRKTLKDNGIFEVNYNECTKQEKTWLKKHFATSILPVIGAQIVDARHPLPTLQSGIVYCMGLMNYQQKEVLAVVSIPSHLNKVVKLPTQGGVRYVTMESVILANLNAVFKGATTVDCLKFYLIRNADVAVSDELEDDEDYTERMSQMLKKRKSMPVVRMEVSKKPTGVLKKFLVNDLKVNERQLYVSSMPLDRSYLFDIAKLLVKEQAELLSYPAYTPKLSADLDYSSKLFDQILKKDVLLSYPYQSMDPFLMLVKEASNDPEVSSIRITIYRLARRARLVDYLCTAAENGKEVDVLIELKARFDEQNNIDYSSKLLDAGCNVYYGFEDYKVHSKICLITRIHEKKPQHVALIATGNFNENTARTYTDFAYMTARTAITGDAVKFFRNMMTGQLDGSYRNLLVSPVSLKSTVLQLIEREIEKKEKGRILFKLNSITDEEIIEKLQEASDAGVQVDLIVRGITCILPGVEGKTENVHVRSIVGRYLEHSRIYCFGQGRSEKMYISSADFMTRNTEHRVEIATPILDSAVRRRLHEYLDLQLSDNVKARCMDAQGKYRKVTGGDEWINSQDEEMKRTVASTQTLPKDRAGSRHGLVFDTKFVGKGKKK